MSERIAMITGTFDPITSGHMDLVRRAARLFDTVYIAVMSNGEKKTLFTQEQRLKMLSAAVEEAALSGVRVDVCTGLASDFARERGVQYIIRGARNATDFDYESSLSAIMKRFMPTLETVILPASPTLACVSSTYVRELLKYGAPIGDAMPARSAALALSFLSGK